MAKRNPSPETKQHSSDLTITANDRKAVLILLDLLALNGGFLFSLGFRPDYELSWTLIADHPHWFVLLNVLWFTLAHLSQLYDLEKASRWKTALLPVFGVGLLTLAVFTVLPYLPPLLPPSRLPLFVSLLAPTGLLVLFRALYLIIFRRVDFQRKVLIIGAGWAGKSICQVLLQQGEYLFQVEGFLDDDPELIGQAVLVPQGPEPGAQRRQLPVLGSSSELLEIASQRGVTLVVLAVTHQLQGELYQNLIDSLAYDLEVVPMPLLYEQLTGRVPVEHIGDHWSLAMPLEYPGADATQRVGKRLFDLFWASLGLGFLILAFPVIALAIYLDSPGPILYRQKRLGRHGEEFIMIKFRSMVPAAEQGKAVWADENDSRVTRVGRFLRKSHLDEFPQILNILKGEMSVVGPRPERPEFVKTLAEEIPFYRTRLMVKPGMAGWGLIHHGYGDSVEDALIKLQYDLYYIKHQSILLDFYILARTFWETLTFGGR